ncbi:PAS domain S-box-containing protein [Sporomusaceae bacterium BoRhaA]|uniref:PAS domain-containing sensor histidine kinase n=1 Tax=Pelorhabdus rhamnosifermentans TaxID=2772457 RepID=UPI001C05FBC7|nr:PAS domain-containing sensor histidine kinase [Pelorhabdus rhamnosifermentans]MBU2703005.1 PAS domain S-box-containing protein [Pelorhabdus rhamnosifermentans]
MTSELSAFLESILDACVLSDSTGKIVQVNSQAERLFKRSRNELVQVKVIDLLPASFLCDFLVHWQKVVHSDQAFQFQKAIMADEYWIKIFLSPYDEGVAVFFRNVTTDVLKYKNIEKNQCRLQKILEKQTLQLAETNKQLMHKENGNDAMKRELRQANHKFFKTFYTSLCMMTLHSLDGKIINANSRFLAGTGFNRAEVLGRTVTELHLCSSQSFHNLILTLRQNHATNKFKLSFCTKQGELRLAFVFLETIRLHGQRVILAQIEDITEDRRLQSEMYRLDCLSLVGEMAAGVSHEVRNPMTTVRGFLQMMMKKEDCSRYKGFYELMIHELDRANSLISEFLTMARNKPTHFVQQDLNAVVGALEPLLYAQALGMGKNIKFIPGPLPIAEFDGKEIRQLILNLVGNALDAMSAGGTVTIKTCATEETILLVVADEGSGITPDVLKKMGTPFFTTKDKGTGLGLSVCYRIAKHHGATIDVATSSVGTTFTIAFPLINEMPRLTVLSENEKNFDEQMLLG